jgi:hypothetical protein
LEQPYDPSTIENSENTNGFCDIEDNENDFKQIDEEIARLPENSDRG